MSSFLKRVSDAMDRTIEARHDTLPRPRSEIDKRVPRYSSVLSSFNSSSRTRMSTFV